MHIEINLKTNYVVRKKNLPVPKFAHGACLCADQIVITSGISDMMLNMGMRSVPIGENDCYSFDIYKNVWR